MSVNPAFAHPEDPHVAAVIARAEHRRGKLERVSDVGVQLVEQIGADAAAASASGAVNEAWGGDPVRAYATVSRAVRMTVALEARLDDEILALRRGEFPPPRRTRAPAASETAPAAPAPETPAPKVSDPRRERADVAVREAIYLGVATITEARERLDALNERLFDRECYDILLNLPFRDAVAAICADLGLAPDWSLWTDAGFVAPPDRRRVDWTTLCANSPPPVRVKPPPPHRRQ